MAAVILGGCSIGNISPDACETNDECVAGFGLGAICDDGYCAAPPPCVTGHDCRRVAGGGACIEGQCVAQLPFDPTGACSSFEPPNLPDLPLVGDDAPLIIGGMYFLNDSFGPPIRDASTLAVRQINEFGGMNGGRRLALVICDNFGDKAAAYEADRDGFVTGAVEYLAGRLGVPFAVGPLRSADAAPAVDYLTNEGRRYPTALITPSATSAVLSGPIDSLAEGEIGLFWRTAPSDEFQAKVLAQSVVGQHPMIDTGVNKVVVSHLEDEYGIGFQQIFQASYSGESVPKGFAENATATEIADGAASEGSDAVVFIDVEVDRARAFVEEMAARSQLSSRYLLLTDGSRNLELFTGASTAARNFLDTRTAGTAPAPEQTPLFATFKDQLQSGFGWDADAVVFTEHAYDATYAGAAAVVWASQGDNNQYDGRQVAEGLLQLLPGMPIDVGATGWTLIKTGLTSGARTVNLNGVSGDLDWDPNGEVKAPIEVWRPRNDSVACGGNPPCLVTVETIPVSAL
ncbi:MAG TPA: hypothetical protein VFB62_05430 [Polyangiaceae bacterium]|jgi:branched-chain amino acid transport system substrate-binding protein|nr:hypothetical protein [Polyangiaceae bacterium]